MQRPAHTSSTESIPHSLAPAGGGWHCSHLFYSFDRTALAQLTSDDRAAGSRDLVAALDPAGPDAPLRLQTTITSGQKADFGVMLLDPDPLKIDRVHQRLMAGRLGPAIVPRWSFVSMTEISEYVQSAEQFGERLVAEGMDANTAEFKTRVKGYADRLVEMNRQRLTPDFPPYRATCFYPMNKKRKVGENWFTLPKEERGRPILVFILYLVFFFSTILLVPFHPDESTQIYMSRDVDVLFTAPGNLFYPQKLLFHRTTLSFDRCPSAQDYHWYIARNFPFASAEI